MAEKVMDYEKDVIQRDVVGAELLAEILGPTMDNNMITRNISAGKGGVNVCDFDEDHLVVAVSTVSDYKGLDHKRQAEGLVGKLNKAMKSVGGTPVAFTSNVDSQDSDPDVIRDVAYGFKGALDKINASAVNGENAVLGDILNVLVNLSGTMIGYVHKDKFKGNPSGAMRFYHQGFEIGVFSHDNLPIYTSSDGNGTKGAFYQRAGKEENALNDSVAMSVDDNLVIGGILKYVSQTIERANFAFDPRFEKRRLEIEEMLGVPVSLDFNETKKKIRSFRGSQDEGIYVNGSAISTLDEEILKTPLSPKVGDTFLAIQSPENNPRSNGMTLRRQAAMLYCELMIEQIIQNDKDGSLWHELEMGQFLLDYLSRPSEILYPAMQPMLKSGMLSSVYHNSGGAFRDKFAKKIANHGIYTELDNLHKPSPQEIIIIGMSGYSQEKVYATSGVGNDAVVSTPVPELAIKEFERLGYKANIAGIAEEARYLPEEAKKVAGAKIKTYSGAEIEYLVDMKKAA